MPQENPWRRRSRPGRATQAAPKSTASDFLHDSPDHCVQAPTLDDRVDAQALAAAADRGYRMAVRCLDCGHWLVNGKSVRLHRGPVCRARAAAS